MIFCSDPALSQLKDQGYNVIRLPREGIKPLDVLAGTGSHLEHLGALSTVWESDEKEPNTYERTAGSIKASSSNAIKASLGLSILDDLLAGFGISSPKVRTAFRRTRTLTFEYDQPDVFGVQPFDIGKYLKAGDLAENSVLEKYLRDSRIYLISELLLSKNLRVVAEAKSGGEVAVDAGVLKDAIEAKVELDIQQEAKTSITFKGKQAVAFGFKAFELMFQDGSWSVGDFADPGSVAFDPNNAPVETSPAKFESSFVKLSIPA